MVVGEAESTLGIGALQVCRKNWKEPEDNSGPDRLIIYKEGQWRLFLRSGGRNSDLRTQACPCLPVLLLSFPSCEVQVPGAKKMFPGSLSLESPSQPPPPKGRWGRGNNLSIHMHGSGKNPGRSYSW